MSDTSVNADLEAFQAEWQAEITMKIIHDLHNSNRPFNYLGSNLHEMLNPPAAQRMNSATPSSTVTTPSPQDALSKDKSATEYYELGAEMEAAGQMKESLDHYRTAFKLDPHVEQNLKRAAKSAEQGGSSDESPSLVSNLAASFSQLSHTPSEYERCYFAGIPDEILEEILKIDANRDIGAFVRLSLVSKRFAYLIYNFELIWREFSFSKDFGFPAMHYAWNCNVLGGPLDSEDNGVNTLRPNVTPPTFRIHEEFDNLAETDNQYSFKGKEMPSLVLNPMYPTWRDMFKYRPRVRFNGCYISKAVYYRDGALTLAQNSFNAPVHVVTYYRYLRFFRDGTVIALLSTHPPSDVVPFLTKSNLPGATHQGHHSLPLPMVQALRGRWRLSSIEECSSKSPSGLVEIETQSASSRHLFKIQLTIQSVGKVASINKLSWKCFWSYDRDQLAWTQFPLCDIDKPYFWSRVKSYGC
ncbi:MAG: hypothetical protein M1829_005256 [Trizodia sp. TS-e1964]|nr:MAG: hypothetical protein M1829_005256 [Trizodia sp. TS-e1964]